MRRREYILRWSNQWSWHSLKQIVYFSILTQVWSRGYKFSTTFSLSLSVSLFIIFFPPFLVVCLLVYKRALGTNSPFHSLSPPLTNTSWVPLIKVSSWFFKILSYLIYFFTGSLIFQSRSVILISRQLSVLILWFFLQI